MKYEIEYEGDGLMFTVAAFHGDKVVGIAYASLIGQSVFLNGIHVDIPMRGQGIGTDLLNLVASEALDNGALGLNGQFRPDIGSEEKLKKFYERWGLKVEKGIFYGEFFH